MTHRARRLFLLLALSLVPLAAIQRPARVEGSQPPFWALDHRPVAAIALYNGSYARDNPWGLQDCWRTGSTLQHCGHEGGVAWLMNEINRRYCIGYRRFMLALPAGREANLPLGTGWPSAQWHLLDTAGIDTLPGSISVTHDLAALLTPWLAGDPDVQVLIYQGLRFNPTLPEPWNNRSMDGSIAPDLTRDFDRLVVRENTQHWLALSPRAFLPRLARPQIGFAFDNTGVESTRDALVAVLNDSEIFGTGVHPFVSGEAIPRLPSPSPGFPGDVMPDPMYVSRAPWFGTMRFHQDFDPQSAWSAPSGTHLGFGAHNRECHTECRLPDGSVTECRLPSGICKTEYELTDAEIHDAIRSAHDRGFVILHYGGAHDAFVIKIHGLPPPSVPPNRCEG